MGSKLFVKMKRDFAVGPRAEMVAARLKLAADAFEVVEFAVGDKANGFVLVGDGLVAAGQVDDAQAGVSQADAPVRGQPVALVIRPAMMQGGRGALQGI